VPEPLITTEDDSIIIDSMSKTKGVAERESLTRRRGRGLARGWKEKSNFGTATPACLLLVIKLLE